MILYKQQMRTKYYHKKFATKVLIFEHKILNMDVKWAQCNIKTTICHQANIYNKLLRPFGSLQLDLVAWLASAK